MFLYNKYFWTEKFVEVSQVFRIDSRNEQFVWIKEKLKILLGLSINKI